MIAVVIYPKDVTSIIRVPSRIKSIEDVQNYLIDRSKVESGDLAIIKNDFYKFRNNTWYKISDLDAKVYQATFKTKLCMSTTEKSLSIKGDGFI